MPLSGPGSNLPGGRHPAQQQQQRRHYRRMPPDSSFSSFSDAGSGSFLLGGGLSDGLANGIIARRPSVDTISTYLSHESAQQQFYRRQYGLSVVAGGATRPTARGSYGYYGGSLGSQVGTRLIYMLDIYS